jgi:hypothetical protein
LIALTHIGFTENPASVEVDANVDTNLIAQTPGLDAVVGAHSHTNPATGFGPYKYLPSIVPDVNGKPVVVTQAYRYNNTLSELSLGLRAKSGGGYEVVSQTGRYLSVAMTTAEDAATKAIVDPYVSLLATYNNTVLGQTTVPIDTTNAYIGETNAANLQAEASVAELASHGITDVDFHISGAMTQSSPKILFPSATVDAPQTVKVSDMFTLMPYENSLVVLSMNGPQLKAVLERGYRNYYYYKYVSGYGGYSYYTTCMLDINKVGRIYYKDTSPTLPDGNNVVALVVNGKSIDFTDATKYYNVSTVNYLAAGSCNFNNAGVSLWPLNQIVHDTQYYVRDAVIDYITAQATIAPTVEGRLLFNDVTAPVVTINAPMAQPYLHPGSLTLDFSAVDGADGTTPSLAAPSGVKTLTATLDGTAVTNGQVIDLYTLALGDHTLAVTAADYYGNSTTQSVTFSVVADTKSLVTSVDRFYAEGKIAKPTHDYLVFLLTAAQMQADAGHNDAAIAILRYFAAVLKMSSASSASLPSAPNGLRAFNVQGMKPIPADVAALLRADVIYVLLHQFGYVFDDQAPVVTITAPTASTYLHPNSLTLDFSAVDVGPAGLKQVWASLDMAPVTSGQVIDLSTLSLGNHTLRVGAVDNAGNVGSKSVTFSVTATVQSLVMSVNKYGLDGSITDPALQTSLLAKLTTAQTALNNGNVKAAVAALNDFIRTVTMQYGKHIKARAANQLIYEARWVIKSPK